ncbi:MAG: hypothetical protein COA36_02280 [Desulfotalea sp.]|nr:MAG: hypothetical protein COA36_02280 [Desulfotalea sp.]
MKVFVNAVSSVRLADLLVPVELTRKLRRADDYIRLAVVAACTTMQTQGTLTQHYGERCGLVLGSAFSTMQTNFEVLDSVVSKEQASPTLFSHSVFNAAAGYVASTLAIKGAALTITDFCHPFFKALEQAWLAIMSGGLDSCLVLQVETYSTLLADGRKTLVDEGAPWLPGVVCLLLENKKSSSMGLCVGETKITSKACHSQRLLTARQEVTVGTLCQTLYEPLGAAFFLAELLAKNEFQGNVFSVKSDWGDVRLHLNQ